MWANSRLELIRPRNNKRKPIHALKERDVYAKERARGGGLGMSPFQVVGRGAGSPRVQ